LEHLADFEAWFPEFNIPLQKEWLFNSAVRAARNIGDDVAVQRYEHKAQAAFAQCPFAVVGADGTVAVDQAGGEVDREFSRGNQSSWPAITFTIVVRWIKAEVEQGLITSQQARELLGMTSRNPTC